MAVRFESAVEPKMMMDNIIQEAVTSGRAALSPTSPRDPHASFRDVTDGGECHPRINVILACLNASSGERLSSRDRHCYVIPRGTGSTSLVYLAKGEGRKN